MSAEALSLVFEHSKTEGQKRLILLALAKLAERRTKPFFSAAGSDELETLTRISARHVRRLLKELVEDGSELIVHHAGKGRGIKTIYHIVTYSPKAVLKFHKNRTTMSAKIGQSLSPFIAFPTGSA